MLHVCLYPRKEILGRKVYGQTVKAAPRNSFLGLQSYNFRASGHAQSVRGALCVQSRRWLDLGGHIGSFAVYAKLMDAAEARRGLN